MKINWFALFGFFLGLVDGIFICVVYFKIWPFLKSEMGMHNKETQK